MDYIRPASARGRASFGWLNSNHSFSFGHYHDPAHMGFSVLRVINDDTVAPGAGFDTHRHRDMEIISYVLEGTLAHKDSMGQEHVLPAGEIQVMSAGTGVSHSEFNASQQDKVKFLQIWILPQSQGVEPSYQQAAIPQSGTLTALVTPDGRDGSLRIHQDARLYRLVLEQGEQVQLEAAPGRASYLHMISGELLSLEGRFGPGDAFGLARSARVELEATASVEALWFDLPGI